MLLTRNYILFSLLLLLCAIGIYSATMYIIPPRRGEKLVVWHKVSRV